MSVRVQRWRDPVIVRRVALSDLYSRRELSESVNRDFRSVSVSRARNPVIIRRSGG